MAADEVTFTTDDVDIIIAFVEKNPYCKMKENKNTKKKLDSLFKELANKLDKKYSAEDLKLKVDDLEESKRRELVQLEEDVISFFKDNPVLYNHELEDYTQKAHKNKLIKSKAANMIWGEDPPEEDTWTPTDKTEIENKANEIQRTFRRLRTKYSVEKKRHGTTITTGKGRGEIYYSDWVHFDTMNFLDDVGDIPTSSEINPENDLDADNRRGRYERGSRSQESSKEEKKNDRWDKLLGAIKDSSTTEKEKSDPPQLSAEDQWFLSIGKSISKLTPLNQELAKAEIQKVVVGFVKSEAFNQPPPEFQIVPPQIGFQTQTYTSPSSYGIGSGYQNGSQRGWNTPDYNHSNGDYLTSPMSMAMNKSNLTPERRDFGGQPSAFGSQIMNASSTLNDQ